MNVVMLGIFFFFQAEDSIRDRDVTGVQTCALRSAWDCLGLVVDQSSSPSSSLSADASTMRQSVVIRVAATEIGRASGRERVEIAVVAVSLKKKT